jgi:hypothetical protein
MNKLMTKPEYLLDYNGVIDMRSLCDKSCGWLIWIRRELHYNGVNYKGAKIYDSTWLPKEEDRRFFWDFTYKKQIYSYNYLFNNNLQLQPYEIDPEYLSYPPTNIEREIEHYFMIEVELDELHKFQKIERWNEHFAVSVWRFISTDDIYAFNASSDMYIIEDYENKKLTHTDSEIISEDSKFSEFINDLKKKQLERYNHTKVFLPYLFPFELLLINKDAISKRCNIYKEELLQNRFHPKNVSKFNDWGFDGLDEEEDEHNTHKL